MADNADVAAEIAIETVAIAAQAARAPMPAGTPGECEQCEWWMPRLVDRRCAFCRDGRQRPPDWEPPVRPPSPPEAVPPAIQETIAMPAKTIQLPASATVAINAVEARAKSLGESLGVAAADLIVAGSQSIQAEAAAPLSMRERLFAAIDVVAGLAAEILNQPDASAATARAEAAEREAESLRESLDVATARANAAVEKIQNLRAALAA